LKKPVFFLDNYVERNHYAPVGFQSVFLGPFPYVSQADTGNPSRPLLVRLAALPFITTPVFMADPGPDTILFDGVCNLCNGFVQFVIRHDPECRFRFAALQSEAAQQLLHSYGLSPAVLPTEPDSVLLLSQGRLYSHSSAVLRIAHGLGGAWRLAELGWALPGPWRDALYRWVARNRYRWFGREESCMLPTPALKARFL
jgi:predicted DCC family thiol-disulfide oxidoreductase YuxK